MSTVIVDISSLPKVRNRYGEECTNRTEVLRICQELHAAGASGVGVDVDFSLIRRRRGEGAEFIVAGLVGDEGMSDPEFLRKSSKLREGGFPMFLGVGRQADLPARYWFSPSGADMGYGLLGAFIVAHENTKAVVPVWHNVRGTAAFTMPSELAVVLKPGLKNTPSNWMLEPRIRTSVHGGVAFDSILVNYTVLHRLPVLRYDELRPESVRGKLVLLGMSHGDKHEVPGIPGKHDGTQILAATVESLLAGPPLVLTEAGATTMKLLLFVPLAIGLAIWTYLRIDKSKRSGIPFDPHAGVPPWKIHAGFCLVLAGVFVWQAWSFQVIWTSFFLLLVLHGLAVWLLTFVEGKLMRS